MIFSTWSTATNWHAFQADRTCHINQTTLYPLPPAGTRANISHFRMLASISTRCFLPPYSLKRDFIYFILFENYIYVKKWDGKRTLICSSKAGKGSFFSILLTGGTKTASKSVPITAEGPSPQTVQVPSCSFCCRVPEPTSLQAQPFCHTPWIASPIPLPSQPSFGHPYWPREGGESKWQQGETRNKSEAAE